MEYIIAFVVCLCIGVLCTFVMNCEWGSSVIDDIHAYVERIAWVGAMLFGAIVALQWVCNTAGTFI